MADDWYSNWYKEHNKRIFTKEAISGEDTAKKPRLSEEFTQKLNKPSKYLDNRNKEFESHSKPTPPPIPYEPPKTPQKVNLKNYYSKPYYSFLSQKPKPVTFSQIKIPPVTEKPETSVILSQVEEKLMPKINKTWIILATLIIILIILGGIYFFTQKNTEVRLMPIDILIYNTTADSNILYNGKNLFSISGWETQIEYENQTDRLFGNEEYKKIIFDDKGKAYTAITLDNEIRLEPLTADPTKLTRIGWFTKSDKITIDEKRSLFDKQIKISLSSNKDYIKNSTLAYYLYKGKPYFKLQFSAGVEDKSLLGDFKYGLVIVGYDIYSQSGEIFVNDNIITQLNKSLELTLVQGKNITKNIPQSLKDSVSKTADMTRQAITRKGSTFEDNSDYQIFVDKNQTRAIVVYSPYILLYSNLFYWNVFQVNVLQLEDGNYSPLYIIVIDNPKLSYNNETKDWNLDSTQFKGEIKSYINKVINEIGDKND